MNETMVDCSSSKDYEDEICIEEMQQLVNNSGCKSQQRYDEGKQVKITKALSIQISVKSNTNKVQQETNRNLQSMCQPENKLDIEIKEIRKLMLKGPQKRYFRQRRMDDSRMQMTEQVYINKEGGELQHKVWKHGILKKTTRRQQQHDEVDN